jgi:hypothetical protein
VRGVIGRLGGAVAGAVSRIALAIALLILGTVATGMASFTVLFGRRREE